MRLSRLTLENYGVFERTEIALSAVPGTIDLVVAPNGAGKSILRGALHDLLFGIGNQSPLDFRFGYRGMSLHAEAVTATGEAFDFGWRKQGKRFFNGDPMEAGSRLAAALGQIRPHQLEHLFALDTHRLREGGRELASGGDSLGVALLSGTGELASARRLRSSLEERRRAIFEKGKLKPPLNAASRALDLARAALREATQPPRERDAQEKAVAAARLAVLQAEALHRDAQERARRYDRIGRTRKPLQQLAEAEAWLAAHPDAPALSQDLAPRLEAARAARSLAVSVLSSATAQLAQARDYAQARARDAAAIAEEAALNELGEAIRSIEDAQRDLPLTRAARDAAAVRIAALCAEIGADAPVEEAGSLLPTIAAVAAARDLITRYEAARGKREESRRRAEAAGQDLDEARQAPKLVEEIEDAAALTALLREIRAAGDPAVAARAAAQAAMTAASEARIALASVPGWTGGLAALRACPTLAEPALQRLADTLAEAAARHQGVADRHAALLVERENQARDLAALREARVAEPARLARARALRDDGWRLLQQRLAGSPDGPAESAYAAGETLTVRFDRHLREADTVADERATDSARVAEAARLDRALADTQALDAAASALAAALQAREAALAAWHGACAPAGLADGATMAEARAFLAARATALRQAETAEAAAQAAAGLVASHTAFAARIARHVGTAAGESLPSYLAAADRAIEAQAAAANRRLEHAAGLRRAQKTVDQAARDHALAEAAMEQWHEAWAQALAALGRPAGEAPAATTEILTRLEELRGHVRDLADRAPRVLRMEAAVAAFATDVSALVTRLAHAPAGDPTATARSLAQRLKQALEDDTRWKEAQHRLKMAAQAHTDAIAADTQAGHVLDALIAATGAATIEAADLRLAASRERYRMEALRDAARASLAEEGEGQPYEVLRADLGSLEPSAMASAREDAHRDSEAAAQAQQVAAVALSQAEKAYAEAASATSATDAAADHAAAVTRFGRLLEDELVLRVASDMLARAMDAVEQKAGEGAPARISRAFASVTGGAYAVATEDDGGRTLLRVRENAFPNEEPRPIEALSEGTRDQLYLALRIVALEDFTAVSPPLPFIADDVLQTFDDTRAVAALHALLALSRRVQVIVLTHHQHLAELSRSLPAGCVNIRTL